MDFQGQVNRNLEALRINSYPGRGIIIGLEEEGKALVQVYFLMGRSESSRNRVLIENKDGSVRTNYADSSKAKGDPALIIYLAMDRAETEGVFSHIVSNGKQTENAIVGVLENETLLNSLSGWEYEPDAPNFTPRITAESGYALGKPYGEIVIIRKSALGDFKERFLFEYDSFQSGIGHCVTTYQSDGEPLPSFQGEPYLLPLKGDIAEVAQTIWEALNEANRVSLVTKFIYPDGRFRIEIINKYPIVE